MTPQNRGIHRHRVPPTLAAVAVALVALGALLATLASVPVVVPSDLVNVNTSSAERLADELEVDIAMADALVAERERLGAFESVHQALATPAISRSRRKAAEKVLQTLDVQQADAAQLASALEIPRVLAERVIADRDGQPGGRFGSRQEVLNVTLIEPALADILRSRLVVRTSETALILLLLWIALGCACLVALRVVQARLAPTADPWLVPMAIVPAGFNVVISSARGDPLREPLAVAPVTIGLALGAGAFAAAVWYSGRSGGDRARHSGAATVDAVAVAALAVWCAVCLATDGGGRLGMRGVQWLGPVVMLWVVAGLIRRYAGLGPERLRAATFGPRIRAPKCSFRTVMAWSAVPVSAMLLTALATRQAGAAIAAGVAVVGVLYCVNLRTPSVVGAVLCSAALPALLVLDAAAQTALADWAAPWSTTTGRVPATASALWALASGGPWGTGLGLAPDTTATGGSLFADLGEQLGTAGVGLVLLGAVLLSWRAARIALLATNDGHRMLGVGACNLLAGYTILSACGSLGIVPDTGVRLPFAADSRVAQTVWFALLGWLTGVSATLGPIGVGVDRTELRRRLQELTVVLGILVLGGCTARAAYIATYAAHRIASRTVHVVGTDGPAAIENPRLAAIAAGIERGSIMDASGRILATSRLRDISHYHGGDAVLARRYYRAGRYYPCGTACAPIVGTWTRRDGAQSGIERAFDAHLRGYERASALLPLYRAKDLPAVFRPRPLRGGDVVLTINGILQEDAHRILERISREVHPAEQQRAAVVVMNAATGQPIVAASVPSVDPNKIVLRSAGGSTASGLMLPVPDHARSLVPAPPGPFKIATALACGPEGLAFETTCAHTEVGLRWDDNGVARSIDMLQDDPRDAPHGRIGMQQAVRHSCNIWFGRYAASIGAQAAYDRMVSVLGSEAVPKRDDFGRRLPLLFAGLDGMMVTPTQMAELAGSLGLGIAPLRSEYWHELRSPYGRPTLSPLPTAAKDARPLSPDVVLTVKRALTDAVSGGAAAEVFRSLRVSVAGKAASVPVPDVPNRTDAWFVGFAPVQTPAFAFACWIENGGSGTRTAGRVMRDLLREMVGP